MRTSSSDAAAGRSDAGRGLAAAGRELRRRLRDRGAHPGGRHHPRGAEHDAADAGRVTAGRPDQSAQPPGAVGLLRGVGRKGGVGARGARPQAPQQAALGVGGHRREDECRHGGGEEGADRQGARTI
jgi:hypothetical protein